MPPDNPVYQVIADNTAQNHAHGHEYHCVIEKRPETAHEEKQEEDNDSGNYRERDEDRGMIFEHTECNPGVLDVNNPEKPDIEKRLTPGQVRPYPRLAELVYKNDEQDDAAEDRYLPPTR